MRPDWPRPASISRSRQNVVGTHSVCALGGGHVGPPPPTAHVHGCTQNKAGCTHRCATPVNHSRLGLPLMSPPGTCPQCALIRESFLLVLVQDGTIGFRLVFQPFFVGHSSSLLSTMKSSLPVVLVRFGMRSSHPIVSNYPPTSRCRGQAKEMRLRRLAPLRPAVRHRRYRAGRSARPPR